MLDRFSRSKLLIGEESIDILKDKKVAVFGVGGVGGYACEALVRSGIGNIDIIDNDTVSITNINRQIIALETTIGRYKVDVLKERLKDINPECNIGTYKSFYLPQNSKDFDLSKYDYIIDAVDTIAAKIELIVNAKNNGVNIISSMGAANKIYPEKLKIADISKTSYCPLARVMRRELKKRGIYNVKVIYSDEEAKNPESKNKDYYDNNRKDNPELDKSKKRAIPGSMIFVPAISGLLIADTVIKDLVKQL